MELREIVSINYTKQTFLSPNEFKLTGSRVKEGAFIDV
jgi:hypothetical protein